MISLNLSTSITCCPLEQMISVAITSDLPSGKSRDAAQRAPNVSRGKGQMKTAGRLTSFRTSETMRSKLQRAAEENGVSVNQEINDRLEASFDDSRDPDKVFASRAMFGLMKVV